MNNTAKHTKTAFVSRTQLHTQMLVTRIQLPVYLQVGQSGENSQTKQTIIYIYIKKRVNQEKQVLKREKELVHVRGCEQVGGQQEKVWIRQTSH